MSLIFSILLNASFSQKPHVTCLSAFSTNLILTRPYHLYLYKFLAAGPKPITTPNSHLHIIDPETSQLRFLITLEDLMNSRKFSEMLRKWQKLAKVRKNNKGHFVVYTEGGKRFVVPLYYLNHPIFRVLLEMAEQEFGPMVHGPIKIPCEEELMDYIISSLRRNPTQEVEKALVSITTCRKNSLSSFFPHCHYQNHWQEIVIS